MVGVAGFEQQDLAVAVGDETRRRDAAGGTAADDDMVVFLGQDRNPPRRLVGRASKRPAAP